MTVTLVPLDREHLPAVEELGRDPDVLRHTRVPEPPPPGFAETWLGLYERGRADGTREGFAVVDGGGEFLGLALAGSIDAEARTAELGYVVAPAARGRGVATAKRVAERSGHRFEGVLRSRHLEQDTREDTEIWSRLPSDP